LFLTQAGVSPGRRSAIRDDERLVLFINPVDLAYQRNCGAGAPAPLDLRLRTDLE
jgi:hypothetical protein